MNTRLCEPIYFDNRGITVSAGVGVVRQRAGEISAGELVRAANITLHRAKRVGRGQGDRYDAEYDTPTREHYQLAAEIPGAWENGGIVALRAVLGWERADGTALGHSECLALAEQTGLVVFLGRWIVEKTCRMHAQVAQVSNHRPEKPPLLRVDLTAQLSQDPDLVGVVRDTLAATGLRAEQLWVGVPLTALTRGHGDVLDNVSTVAQLGTEVVLIGAPVDHGYLAYLEDLPIGAVEIGPDTVARIAARPGNDSLAARAVYEVISLVYSAGVRVIVPGVDTAEQERWWRSAGADTAWGAHFGPPATGSVPASGW